MQKTIGLLCLAVGAFLLVGGRKIADSFGSHVQPIFTGAPTDRAMYLYLGGLVLLVLGVAQLFWPPRRK
jgi:TRAP-type C4-dicarboxylate transport system permease small subunit